jgi:hypothetical protein
MTLGRLRVIRRCREGTLLSMEPSLTSVRLKHLRPRLLAAQTDLAAEAAGSASQLTDPDAGAAWTQPPRPSAAQRLQAGLRIHWLALAFGLAGVVVRLRQYTSGRSLWLDESMITANLLDRSVRQLFHPLGLQQGAPIGWLLVEKSSIHVFGSHELSLRLFSFVAGVAVLVLTWDVSRRLLHPRSAALAVLLVALSPALIRFSSEVKQYSTDAAAAMTIVDVSIALVQSGLARLSLRRALLSGIAIGASCLISHTAVFVTLGLVVVLAMSFREFTRRTLVGITLGGAVIGASILLQYRVTIEPLRKNVVFLLAWRANYPKLFSGWSTRLAWLPSGLERFARDPFHSGPPLIVLAILLMGAVTCWRRSPRAATLLVAPLVVNVGTALTYHYPLGDRLATYYLPLAAVLAAAAADPVLASARIPALADRARVVVCTAVILLLAVTQIPAAARLTAHPQIVSELAPVLREVRADIDSHAGVASSEQVFSYWGAGPAYVYYARRFGLPTTSPQIGDFTTACPDDGVMREVRVGDRFWFVYTSINAKVAADAPPPGDPGTTGDIDKVIRRLGAYAVPVGRIGGRNAGAIEFRRTVAGFPPVPVGGACLGGLPLPLRA